MVRIALPCVVAAVALLLLCATSLRANSEEMSPACAKWDDGLRANQLGIDVMELDDQLRTDLLRRAAAETKHEPLTADHVFALSKPGFAAMQFVLVTNGCVTAVVHVRLGASSGTGDPA